MGVLYKLDNQYILVSQWYFMETFAISSFEFGEK